MMAILLLPLTWRAAAAHAQEVTVRRGVTAVKDPVAGVDSDGVTIALSGPLPPGEPLPVLPWDQVAGITGPFADHAQAYAKAADAAWRARTRLERGDLSGAEPLFEQLFSTYGGRKGAMAQLVCGGLLLCRNARGATSLAMPAFLGYLEACDGDPAPRLVVRGGDVADPSDLSPIDVSWRLSPALPPIWLSTLAVQTSSRGTWKAYPGRVGQLSELYRLSQATELTDVSASLPQRPNVSDDSLCLVWEIVSARAGDAPLRAQARELLRARLGGQIPPWIAAWCRAGIGRSLLREVEHESQLLGIAELLAVPAAAEHAVPSLTGICLAEAAVALQMLGDLKGAAAVRSRLTERFAGHPVIEWEPLRSMNAAAAPLRPVPAEGSP